MFTKFIAKFGFALGCLFATLIFIGVCGLSWLVTCGLVYLIALCFAWEFSWWIATGVWLVFLLINAAISR